MKRNLFVIGKVHIRDLHALEQWHSSGEAKIFVRENWSEQRAESWEDHEQIGFYDLQGVIPGLSRALDYSSDYHFNTLCEIAAYYQTIGWLIRKSSVTNQGICISPPQRLQKLIRCIQFQANMLTYASWMTAKIPDLKHTKGNLKEVYLKNCSYWTLTTQQEQPIMSTQQAWKKKQHPKKQCLQDNEYPLSCFFYRTWKGVLFLP